MRKPKPDQATMYLADQEQIDTWEAVIASFGSGYSQSGILYKLVQERNFEVKDGTTKRGVALETLRLVQAVHERLESLIVALAARGIEL